MAFELKNGNFKPEYAGQLNFYLNVLEDLVKLQVFRLAGQIFKERCSLPHSRPDTVYTSPDGLDQLQMH